MKNKLYALMAILGLAGNAYMAILPYKASAAVASWQKGVSVQSRWNTDFASQSFKQSIDNLAAANVNFVSLIIPYYQSNLYSTDIAPGWNTPDDASLISGINYLHSKGIKVMLTPHINSYTGEWRANINPSDRSTWYANYSSMLNHLAQIAQQTRAEQICVGTELIVMATYTSNPDNTQQWANMISQVRSIFSGKLTYGANWGPPPNAVDEKRHIGFWQQLDYVGIDAYYNLNQASDNSVASLENAWNSWLNSDILHFANQVGKPILFTEVGYKSVTSSHSQPWDYNFGGPADQNEQANSYTALLDFWNKQQFMQGVFFWDWSSDPNAGGAGDGNYTPQNKQAQGVLTQWFGGSGSNAGGSPTTVVSAPSIPCPGPVTGAFTGCYFSDQVLGNSVFTRTDQNINFDWGNGSPDISIPADHFSARWVGNFNFNSGGYTFSLTTDDGARLYIDGQLVVDKWLDQPPTAYTYSQNMQGGTHQIKLEYYENGGGATAKLSWAQTAGTGTNPPTGTTCPKPSLNSFTGCYYTDKNFATLGLIRNDGAINFDWGTGSPDPAIPADGFSAVWQGNFDLAAGSYTFAATGDDGIRLSVDGNTVIDKMADQPATTYDATINLSAGTHLIKLEYYENGGNAVAKLSWAQNNGSTTPPPSGGSNQPPPSNNIVFINNYPTLNGNYIDCYGNIDNDPNHHTGNSNDTDSAHHIGQNCPAGSLVGQH